MAQTPSTMQELGTPAPHFTLPDPSGVEHTMAEFADAKALLVMFICNHCPFVKLLAPALADFAREYQAKGLAVVAIQSNDVANYPDDGPEKMAEEIAERGYTFPYLYDESQEVAKVYRASCTPDFFLYDGERRLAYRGQFDGARPGNGVDVTGEDMRRAADAVLAGRDVPGDQSPSIGCNIKWKSGNEPDYYG
ncbi:MAG: thioredoxin family protein [Planctomycetota bacterium]